jgi:hypothetical protein
MAEIIYPNNPHKYLGATTRFRNGKYTVRFDWQVNTANMAFNTAQEAEQYRMGKSKEYGLVKNLIHDCGDHLEVELTRGQRAKFDREDLPIIDGMIWMATDRRGKFYATQGVVQLHNRIMNFVPANGLTIDHINNDALDNRKTNLRIANKVEQAINRGMHTHNFRNQRSAE